MANEISNSPVKCFDKVMEQPEKIGISCGTIVYYSTRDSNKVTANEDSLAIIPVNDSAAVLIIADGMGGLPAGEEASRSLVNHIIKSVNRLNNDEISIREAILDGIEAANKELLERKYGSGTTLVVAEIRNNILRIYHAGDSLAMLVGNRGKIKYSAIPHSPTGYALEAGMIDKSEAMLHAERHLISNYVGSQDMRVEIGPNLKIARRDTLILASDGLSDNLYDTEIAEICRKGDMLGNASKLAEECQRYMTHPVPDRSCHPDDLSFILYRINI